MKKKILTILIMAIMVMPVAACGNSSSSSMTQEDDLELYIDEIAFLGIEDDISYWNVYLADSINWGEDDSLMEDLALHSIKQCIAKEESQSTDSWSIMGYESDGNIAFSWGGIDGTDEIRYYKDSAYTHNYSLTDSQYEYIGLTAENNSDTTYDVSEQNEDDNVSINTSNEDIEAIKSELNIKAVPTDDGLMCVFITNNSNTIIDELDVQINYKDENGTIIDMDSDGHDMVLPESTVVSRMKTPDSYVDYEIIKDIELGVNPKYENHAADVVVNSNQGEKCIIVEITNNSDVSIDEIEYIAVLYQGDDIVTVEFPEDVRDVSAGQTITEKVDTYNKEYDHFEIYLNQAHTFGL